MHAKNKIHEKIQNFHPKILIIGDLAVDYVLFADRQLKGNINLVRPDPIIGGSAYNAAKAFKHIHKMMPVICASVGQDIEGQLILDSLRKEEILFAGTVSSTLMTGFVTLIYAGDNDRLIINDSRDSANNYSIDTVQQALSAWQIGKGDFILFLGYAVPRCGISHCIQLMEILNSTGADIVVDLVPHNLHEMKDTLTQLQFTLADCNDLFKHVTLLIAEYQTLCGFMHCSPVRGAQGYTEPPEDGINNNSIKNICAAFPGKFFDIRYGIDEISMQIIYKREFGEMERLKTNYEQCLKKERRGFGDKLTAQSIMKINNLINVE